MAVDDAEESIEGVRTAPLGREGGGIAAGDVGGEATVDEEGEGAACRSSSASSRSSFSRGDRGVS